MRLAALAAPIVFPFAFVQGYVDDTPVPSLIEAIGWASIGALGSALLFAARPSGARATWAGANVVAASLCGAAMISVSQPFHTPYSGFAGIFFLPLGAATALSILACTFAVLRAAPRGSA